MFGPSPAVRIFVCLPPTDLRRSFDGLAALAEMVCGQSPLSGHLFLFRNRRRDALKILYWDHDGLCIWYKRLERGTFELPGDRAVREAEAGDPPARFEIRATELALLLGGIDLTSAQKRPRYQRPA